MKQKLRKVYMVLCGILLMPLMVSAQEAAISVADAIHTREIFEIVTEQSTVFETARDTFYSQQTTANKNAFDAASVAWARQLVAAQLKYIDIIEQELHDNLETNDVIDNGWLQSEREMLETTQLDLESLETYAPARVPIGQTLATWSDVRQKIQQMRVYTTYDSYGIALRQARQVYDTLVREQSDLAQKYSINADDTTWLAWQQIFDTYASKLNELETEMRTQQARLAEPRDWENLDADDDVWQEEQQVMQSFMQGMQTLGTLQSQSVDTFLAIADQLVLPAQQPIE